VTTRRWRRGLVASIAFVMVVGACASAPPSGGTGPEQISRNEINVRLEGDWRNQLNHMGLLGASDAGNQYSMAVYDRLVALSPDGSKIVPYVATSWKATLSSVTFTIRNDVTCSDGTKLTPSAIANSYAHLTDPKFLAPNQPATIGSRLLGTGPFTVSADDAAGTFTFNVGRPNNELLQSFAWPHVSIICPAGFEPGADFSKKSYGSGPFVLDSLTADTIRVKRRADWNWGPNNAKGDDAGRPDFITFRVVSNATTVANLLVTGGLDLASVTGPDVARLKSEGFNESVVQTAVNGFIQINEAPGRVGNDKKVRQALMTAIDPKDWNQVHNAGAGVYSPSVLTQAHQCFEPETQKLVPTPDLNRAKALLLEAGYTAGANGKLQKDGKPLTVIVLSDPERFDPSNSEFVAEQFNKLGATASVTPTSTAIRESGAFDVNINPGFLRIPITGSLPIFFGGAPPPSGSNLARVVDPVVDELLVKARSEEPGVCTGWKEWQRRIVSEYHALPLTSEAIRWFGKNMQPVLIMGSYAETYTFRRSK
jgi:peptide/nickel transport system substrate-binding protein